MQKGPLYSIWHREFTIYSFVLPQHSSKEKETAVPTRLLKLDLNIKCKLGRGTWFHTAFRRCNVAPQLFGEPQLDFYSGEKGPDIAGKHKHINEKLCTSKHLGETRRREAEGRMHFFSNWRRIRWKLALTKRSYFWKIARYTSQNNKQQPTACSQNLTDQHT